MTVAKCDEFMIITMHMWKNILSMFVIQQS